MDDRITVECLAAVLTGLVCPPRLARETIDRKESSASTTTNKEEIRRDRGDMRESAAGVKCP
jgi:hypothetical protein